MAAHDRTHPVYMIGVVASLTEMHAQTIRLYERLGLVTPLRKNPPPDWLTLKPPLNVASRPLREPGGIEGGVPQLDPPGSLVPGWSS